uniref:Cupredoxin n=1 Tax=Mycena chlorophos TaxID=658473 RepID=A0ABQ0LBA8_MYCCL|nr:predicted protein [Mycena chlorophos]
MRFSVVAAVASVLSVASAANIEVLVGANQTLTYTPSSITANIGDTVTFVFTSKNHTVSQSTFTDPCALTTNGISSGFQFVAANATSVPSWSFTVNNVSAPLWFFCEQTNPVSHCSKGMVFAVNPTAAKTFAQFQATAMGGSSSAAVAATSRRPPLLFSGTHPSFRSPSYLSQLASRLFTVLSYCFSWWAGPGMASAGAVVAANATNSTSPVAVAAVGAAAFLHAEILSFEVELASSWVNMMLFMLEIVLCFRYFQRRGRPLAHRIGIGLILFFDTICTGTANAYVFIMFLSFFGRASVFGFEIGNAIQMMLTYSTAVVEQLFLCHLFFILSRKRIVSAVLVFLGFAHLSVSYAAAILVFTLGHFDSLTFQVTSAGAILCAVTDVLIAGFLGYEFFKILKNRGIMHNIWRRSLLLTLTSGAVVALTTLLMMILLIRTEIAFEFFFTIQGRVYALTLLANFLSGPLSGTRGASHVSSIAHPHVPSNFYWHKKTGSAPGSLVSKSSLEKALPALPPAEGPMTEEQEVVDILPEPLWVTGGVDIEQQNLHVESFRRKLQLQTQFPDAPSTTRWGATHSGGTYSPYASPSPSGHRPLLSSTSQHRETIFSATSPSSAISPSNSIRSPADAYTPDRPRPRTIILPSHRRVDSLPPGVRASTIVGLQLLD